MGTLKKKPITLHFDPLEHSGDYWMRCAKINFDRGLSVRIRVRGTQQNVEDFTSNLKVKKLQLKPLSRKPKPQLTVKQAAAIKLMRKQWKELGVSVDNRDTMDIAALKDREAKWRKHLAGQISGLERPLDLSQDRLIEIEPYFPPQSTEPSDAAKNPGKPQLYKLSLRFDPPLPAGHLDVYDPCSPWASSVSATATANSGNPDLYLWLYHYGFPAELPTLGACSGNENAPDYVSQDRNNIKGIASSEYFWRLHVFAAGNMDTTYQLWGSWTFEVRI